MADSKPIIVGPDPNRSLERSLRLGTYLDRLLDADGPELVVEGVLRRTVGLAMEAGVPDEVSHIIAAHAGEGNMVKRTAEAFIVHHADFMSYEPFKNLKR